MGRRCRQATTLPPRRAARNGAPPLSQAARALQCDALLPAEAWKPWCYSLRRAKPMLRWPSGKARPWHNVLLCGVSVTLAFNFGMRSERS